MKPFFLHLSELFHWRGKERFLPWKHFVEEDSKSPHVNFCSVFLPLFLEECKFWGHIERGSTYCLKHEFLFFNFFFAQIRETEVSNYCLNWHGGVPILDKFFRNLLIWFLIFKMKHDIGSLYISMHYFDFIQMNKPLRYLISNYSNFVFCQLVVSKLNKLLQIPSIVKISKNVKLSLSPF